MKIYICGSHGSGKSTLARYVSENYKLTFIPEVARMVLSEKELQVDSLRANLAITNDFQKSIFYRQLEEEKNSESFVSDRSIIDALAYSTQHTNILPELLQEPELMKNVSNLKNSDSIIFFVRPSKATLQSDGVRESINWDGAVAIDAIIKCFLEMWSIRYFQINTDSMQERIKIINSVLSLAIK